MRFTSRTAAAPAASGLRSPLATLANIFGITVDLINGNVINDDICIMLPAPFFGIIAAEPFIVRREKMAPMRDLQRSSALLTRRKEKEGPETRSRGCHCPRLLNELPPRDQVLSRYREFRRVPIYRH
jgi:hypothetical protein